MAKKAVAGPEQYVDNIRRSGLTIYDPIEVGDPYLWIPAPELELILDSTLRGISLNGLSLRTRSKRAKERVCVALGYPVPRTFKKTQPRFLGQCMDTYVQKSDNLQIYNEEISPTRRYVLIRISDKDRITRVKVVTGDTLAQLDTTGTLTQKYQARCILRQAKTELATPKDTELLRPFLAKRAPILSSPTLPPGKGDVLPINLVYSHLKGLIGVSFKNTGVDQERNRGTALQHLVCKRLGYRQCDDDGQFPDLRHQLLEVKLQTSPTIDIGLVLPSSTAPLDVPQIEGCQIRHCDVRYAIFYAVADGSRIKLTHLFVTTGERFFTRFPQFGGKVLNKKLQIPLPIDFFD